MHWARSGAQAGENFRKLVIQFRAQTSQPLAHIGVVNIAPDSDADACDELRIDDEGRVDVTAKTLPQRRIDGRLLCGFESRGGFHESRATLDIEAD